MIFGVTTAVNVITWRGAWSNAIIYNKNAIVGSGGNNYISLFGGNVGNSPAVSPGFWDLWSTGGAGMSWQTGSDVGVGVVDQEIVHRCGGIPSKAIIIGTGTDEIIVPMRVDGTKIYVFIEAGQPFTWSAAL